MPGADGPRRVAPLAAGLGALLLSVLVLPSALNVPMSNPTQTLEFAPVPLTEDQPPPPDSGNVEHLGLGSSSTLPGDALGGDASGPPPPPPTPPPIPVGAGERPVTKRCVGDPPRQTEDAMSPPCVAHFEGDNGGATHQGVTADEVVVLWYLDGVIRDGSDTTYVEDEQQYAGEYFDLGKPPAGDETVVIRNLRRLQQHFNARYQTYGRTVHFWAYYSHADIEKAPDPEMRRSDAADNYAKLRPFAVLSSGLWAGHDDVYSSYFAARGVLSFGSAAGSRPADFFRAFPGLLWSYPPTVEKRAELFSTYVCERLVGTSVVDGEVGVGGPRTFGLLSTTDDGYPQLALLADLIREDVEACGGTIAEEATFPTAYRVTQTEPALYAAENIARFQRAGVTTILWAGGFETDHSRAADRQGYRPEWFVAGDGLHEGAGNSSYQNRSVWQHASVLSTATLVGSERDDPCRAALREADPDVGDGDSNWACNGWTFFEDGRQLFTGIQVAGPRLTPASMERGYRAIPSVPSTDPTLPACFYEPDDYTCVKDATVGHWDPDGQPRTTAIDGCWRMIEGGRRYLAGTWGEGNLDTRRSPDDVCSSYRKDAAFF